MIEAWHTQLFIKITTFVIGGWATAAIMFGKDGASISDVMTAWGREYPFIPVAWTTVMVALAFHWFKW